MNGVSAGNKKLELFVVAAILGVLATLLLDALAGMQREMETAVMQSEVAALRVELLDRLSHREVFGGVLPDSDNPVVWTGRSPDGYLGEFDRPPEQRGVWYFDRSAKLLVYRSRGGEDYRFRLARNAGRVNGPATLAGVGLVRVEN